MHSVKRLAMRASVSLLAVALGMGLSGCTEDPNSIEPSHPAFAPDFTQTPTPVPSASAPADLGYRDLVTVVISYSTWSAGSNEIQISAFMPALVEGDGMCTASATLSGVTVEARGSAQAEPSSTSCGQLALKDPRLLPGHWAVTVAYSSAGSAGQSAPIDVEIP